LYSPNAYNWLYLKSGGPQDIGVTAASTVLDSIGKLNNKLRVAVLDRVSRPLWTRRRPPR
jgi:serine protease